MRPGERSVEATASLPAKMNNTAPGYRRFRVLRQGMTYLNRDSPFAGS
jgi:hypothetical protein